MTFREYAPTGSFVGEPLRLRALATGPYADDEILAISVQTDSAWDGFDGALDALEVGLTDGAVGRVDFADGQVLRVVPADVPDEQRPRATDGDAPAGFGPSAWQGPAPAPGSKTNWHAWYDVDGSGTLSALFPWHADTLALGDLARIGYRTNRPPGTPVGDDWWVTIYTRPTGVDDAGSWYHRRYHGSYGDHAAVGGWASYATDAFTGDVPRMTFDAAGDAFGPLTLAGLAAASPDEEILSITVQTDSGWGGFDGAVDGLEITLRDGTIGRVDFGAGARLVVLPSEVPDEQPPRVVADAPPDYGPEAWQAPAAGKTNWHAWYDSDGSGTLSALFPDVAPTLTLRDIAALGYWTKRPTGTAAGRDWWLTIYTRPDAGDGWYHARYISNFDAHTAEDTWVRYSTATNSGDAPAMTFRRQDASGSPVGPAMTLPQLAAQDGRGILSVTVQTASGWTGFEGLVDGLEIALKDGRVGKVDFGDGARMGVAPSAVPDEDWPRSNPIAAPPNYGAGQGSWLGPAQGKSNWHLWYDADGTGALSTLFPEAAATLGVGALAEISYWTRRPSAFVEPGQDWWVTIYTRPAGAGDDGGWYHRRYISNFGEHTSLDAWTQYSTAFATGDVPAMTFRRQDASGGPVGPAMTLSQLAAQDAQGVLSITLQTDSGWDGFDGSVDGLEVVLRDGSVGRVDLQRCTVGTCATVARAGERLAAIQCESGSWGWPLDGGCPAGYANLVAPTAQGLALAHAATTPASTAMQAAVEGAGDYLLGKVGDFSIADGYLAVTLDEVLGSDVHVDHVRAAFYDRLVAGTYDPATPADATTYDTAAFLALKRAQRSGAVANIAAWDLGMGLYAATLLAERDPGFVVEDAWIDAVEAEVEELVAGGYYDVIGLAGALMGLARAQVDDFVPASGAHAGVAGLDGLAAELLALQIPETGGFTWTFGATAPEDTTTQETAYALLALVEARDAGVSGLDGAIDAAAAWLVATQTDAGGWLFAQGLGEYGEVDGEAVWALVAAGYY